MNFKYIKTVELMKNYLIFPFFLATLRCITCYSNKLISMDQKPFLIAGPCSAETEKQVLDTAISLKKLQPDYFRAGIWKPRTRPGEFDGAGNSGLLWLQKVQSEVGVPRVIVEQKQLCRPPMFFLGLCRAVVVEDGPLNYCTEDIPL